MLGFFAVVGLLLAAAGVYAVMRSWVSLHASEIGIRMALGADRRDVIRLVLLQAAKPLVGGVVLGVAAAWSLQRVIASELYGVSPLDPATFACVAAILLTVAVLSAWLPARRAAAIDPLTALKHE